MFHARNLPNSREILDWSAALDNPDQYDDDRQDEQDVDEATHRVRGDQTQQPQDYKYHRYCPKQVHSPVSLG
jgi:hypothetical protein